MDKSHTLNKKANTSAKPNPFSKRSTEMPPPVAEEPVAPNPFQKRSHSLPPGSKVKADNALNELPAKEVETPDDESAQISLEQGFWASPEAAPVVSETTSVDVLGGTEATKNNGGFYSNLSGVTNPNSALDISSYESGFCDVANPDSIFGILFSFKGRINRSTFWKYSLGMFVVFAILVSTPIGQEPFLATIIGALAIWINSSLHTKRFHDLDKSGIWTLLNLVPVAALWVFYETGFNEGNGMSNRFGPPC